MEPVVDMDLKRQLEIERRLLEEMQSDKIMSRVWTKVQRDFANSLTREKIISGGNQLGKTDIVLALTAMHLMGIYPPWYKGHRFDRPVVWACAGPTGKSTRENLTDRLLGHRRNRGKGWLRESSFDPESDITYVQRDTVDEVWVDHSSGGKSLMRVFSYDQGARRLQGRTVDGVTIDESPKLDVVEELSNRLNATRGWLIGAVSPKEEDAVEIIDMFEESGDLRKVFYYGIKDATWMSEDQRQEVITKNEHNPLAEATLHGRPVARTGLVYRQPQNEYTVDPPRYQGGNTIIGIDLPHSTGYFAAVRLLQMDGVWVVDREWKCSGLNMEDYAQAVREMGGTKIVCAWPHDGGRITGDGQSAAEKYRELGLNFLPMPAHMVGIDGKKHRSLVTIVETMSQMMKDGTLRISNDCPGLLRELSRYRWAKGHVGVVPKRLDDHLHDALAKAVMMLEYAEAARPPAPPRQDNSALVRFLGPGYNPFQGKGRGPVQGWGGYKL